MANRIKNLKYKLYKKAISKITIYLLIFSFFVLYQLYFSGYSNFEGIIFAATPTPSPPTLTDSPDPQEGNSAVTFQFTCDDGANNVEGYVCKDSSCTNCLYGTTTNCWCASGSVAADPSCPYTCPSCTYATNNYWGKCRSSAGQYTAITAQMSFTCKKQNNCTCTGGTECYSGNCATDYDGSGQWCAPATNCVHSTTATCDAICYGYTNGTYAPDCYDAGNRWHCNSGTWQASSCGTDTACRDYYCNSGSCSYTDFTAGQYTGCNDATGCSDDGISQQVCACNGAGSCIDSCGDGICQAWESAPCSDCDITKPIYSNMAVYPASPITFTSGLTIQLNTTWQDNVGLSTALVEHNFTGSSTPHNDTVTTYSGSNPRTYYFNVNPSGSGTFVWRYYANDTSNNWNFTPQQTYTINAGSLTQSDVTISPTDTKLDHGFSPGENIPFDVRVKDQQGNTLSDATVTVNISNSSMNLASFSLTYNSPTTTYKGNYANTVNWALGQYNLTYKISRAGYSDEIIIRTFWLDKLNVTINLPTLTYIPGDTVNIAGNTKSIARGIAFPTNVTVTIYDPDNIQVMQHNTTADASGNYATSWQLGVWAKRGTYTVNVKAVW